MTECRCWTPYACLGAGRCSSTMKRLAPGQEDAVKLAETSYVPLKLRGSEFIKTICGEEEDGA